MAATSPLVEACLYGLRVTPCIREDKVLELGFKSGHNFHRQRREEGYLQVGKFHLPCLELFPGVSLLH